MISNATRILGSVTLALALATTASFANAGQTKHAEAPQKNIVQVARDAGQFTTLIRALQATDLVGTLSGQGHGTWTVFAPTDAAFAKLPAGTLEGLLADPAALKNILLYHVASGEYRAADVVARPSLTMANGKSVTIQTANGVTVNDAKVTATDIAARNGVIHVIDTVLLPN